MDIIAAKRDLRAALLARRDALPARLRAAGAARIAEIGATMLAARGRLRVSVFHSFGSEVDTAPLMQALQAGGHTLCLPVILARDAALVFRRWAPGDRLVEGRFKIKVPPESAAEIEPDVVLTPLLGFDARGYRIGYGGGYYDRTLAKLRAKAPILAVGLAFAAQEVDDIPHAAYDEPVDAVMNEVGYRPLGG